jgi:cell filamentation protein
MRKGTDAVAESFMPVSRLQTGAMFAFQELADDKYLRGMDRDTFIDRLAHHYDQVNYLHPFREGNGCTQRVLWTQVARQAGYDLDWRGVTGAVNDRASRDAMERQDLSGLRTMFATIVHPINETAAATKKNDLQRTVEALRSRARDSNAPSVEALTRSRHLPPAAETTKPPTTTRRNYPYPAEKRESGLDRD